MMNERQIEKKLKHEVEQLGGLAMKFVSPGLAGVPDRLVLLPKGRIYFVELKAPGSQLRPLQMKRKAQLEHFGMQVYVIDSIKGIELFLQEVTA